MFFPLLASLILLLLLPLLSPPPAFASPIMTPPSAALRARAPTPSRRMGLTAKRVSPLPPPSPPNYAELLCSSGTPCPLFGAAVAATDETDGGASPREQRTERPYSLVEWLRADFECLDVRTERGSCGGCLTLGEGRDCWAIPGVQDVACEQGRCAVSECQEGWAVGAKRDTCVKAVS